MAVIFRVTDVIDELGWIPNEMQMTIVKLLASELGQPHQNDTNKVEWLLDKHPDLAKDVLKLVMKKNYREPREEGW